MSKNIVRNVTIASGETDSDELICNGSVLVGFQMPGDWDTAELTFLASADGVTYGNFKVNDIVYTLVSPDADEYIAVNPSDFAGVMYLKFIAENAQAANRVFKAILRGVE